MLRFIINIIFYPLGILILILGISLFADSVAGGLLLTLAGLLTLPVVNRKVVECTNEKLKGWKYVGVTLLAFFIGVSVLPSTPSTDASNVNNTEVANRNNVNVSSETVTEVPQAEETLKKSDTKKIDKNFKDKNYSDLIEMYAGLNEEGKVYFTEKLEKHVVENFKNFEKDNKKTIEGVESLLANFESLDINSELVTFIKAFLQDLKTYETQKSELSSVTSNIPSGSECEILDVYITQRVLNSGFIGGEYTDNYVAYPYTYLFNEPYPDYDADPVIIYSKQPLKEGVGTYYCARSGSYTTTSRGFETSHPKYDVYSSAEWDRYYEKEANDTERKKLNKYIDIIHEGFKKFSEKDVEAAKKVLNELVLLKPEGYWSSMTEPISMWISSYIPGKYEIYISKLPDDYLENSNEVTFIWTMENARYDAEIGALVYSNSVCEKEEIAIEYYLDPYSDEGYSIETLYTGGSGKIFVKDGFVYWEDDKEKDSTKYKFEFVKYEDEYYPDDYEW